MDDSLPGSISLTIPFMTRVGFYRERPIANIGIEDSNAGKFRHGFVPLSP
jgi:hypothetical protein